VRNAADDDHPLLLGSARQQQAAPAAGLGAEGLSIAGSADGTHQRCLAASSPSHVRCLGHGGPRGETAGLRLAVSVEPAQGFGAVADSANATLAVDSAELLLDTRGARQLQTTVTMSDNTNTASAKLTSSAFYMSPSDFSAIVFQQPALSYKVYSPTTLKVRSCSLQWEPCPPCRHRAVEWTAPSSSAWQRVR